MIGPEAERGHGVGRRSIPAWQLGNTPAPFAPWAARLGVVELGVFDQVADGLRALVPPELGALRTQARRWGLKAWFDAEECPRVHYEAQVIGAKHVIGAEHLAIEIGFHAEHPKAPDNLAVIAPLRSGEVAWRDALGPDAVLGPFLGHVSWQRLSETWADPDLSDPEVCFEIADCLAAYVLAVEPLRTDRRR